jgi:putative restriction endonuclease
VPDPRDLELRQAALEQVRELQHRCTDLIPLPALRDGFVFRGERISFGSFYSGIFRPRQMSGPAALSFVTTPPKEGRPPPYEDQFDEQTGRFTYRFRDPASATTAALRQADSDNRLLIAAHELAVPLLYFRGIAPSQYVAVAPVIITDVDRAQRLVEFESAMPAVDMTEAGLVSAPELRRYATREALVRLHQQRFRFAVLHAYTNRCAVCSLREAGLLQAAHIIEDRDPRGEATVVNGISLCAIHHLAYDRNLMGIDPGGMVHIARRLLDEIDGPMLRRGIQGFHGAAILQPRRPADRPDPERLQLRFEQFRAAA